MLNVEIQMTKPCFVTSFFRLSNFIIYHSFVIRDSSFPPSVSVISVPLWLKPLRDMWAYSER